MPVRLFAHTLRVTRPTRAKRRGKSKSHDETTSTPMDDACEIGRTRRDGDDDGDDDDDDVRDGDEDDDDDASRANDGVRDQR
jgi:hypothetical protein